MSGIGSEPYRWIVLSSSHIQTAELYGDQAAPNRLFAIVLGRLDGILRQGLLEGIILRGQLEERAYQTMLHTTPHCLHVCVYLYQVDFWKMRQMPNQAMCLESKS